MKISFDLKEWCKDVKSAAEGACGHDYMDLLNKQQMELARLTSPANCLLATTMVLGLIYDYQALEAELSGMRHLLEIEREGKKAAGNS